MGKREAITAMLKPGGGLEAFALISRDWSADLIGRVLGSYRVVGLLAEGGMSHVYRGVRDDDQFKRNVAIKVAFSAMMTDESRQRFYRERDILAALDHPNIARLLDAGVTAEGWPYLVMEFIEGRPIDEYCDEHLPTLDERLAISKSLVGAVAHAHAHLVIHRDIKPSNVLVTGEGQAKLLDFGIAKLLDADLRPGTMTHALTPAYASPEQLLGKTLTIGSDIFQLGLLLHRVLGGANYFSDTSLEAAVRRAVSPAPVVLGKGIRDRVPRDLITVIEHCLAVEVNDRYRDANSLLLDLGRYETGFPPLVSPTPWGVRFNRFLRRNRAASLIVTISLIMMVGGSGYYTYQLAASRAVAEDRAQTLSRVLETVTRLVGDSYATLIEQRENLSAPDGQDVLQNEPLRSLLDRTDQLIGTLLQGEPQARGELLLLQGRINRVLARPELAQSQLGEALSLARDAGDSPLEVRALLELAQVEYIRYDIDRGWGYARAALEHPSLATMPVNIRANVHIAASEVLELKGEYGRAQDQLRMAIELLEGAGSIEHLTLARAYYELADIYSLLEQTDEAQPWNEKAIALLEALEGPLYRELQWPLSAVGWHYQVRGDHQKAYEYFRRSLDVALANFGDESLRTVPAFSNLGMSLKQLGRYDEALQSYQAALRIFRIHPDALSPNLALLHSNIANLVAERGELALASEHYEQGLAIARSIGEPARRPLTFLLHNYGRNLLELGEVSRAVEVLGRAREERERLFGEDNPSTARTTLMLSRALAAAGRLDEAWGRIQEAERVLTSPTTEEPVEDGSLAEALGQWQEHAGNLAEAERHYAAALDSRMDEYGKDSLESVEVLVALARVSRLAGSDPDAYLADAESTLAGLPDYHPLRVDAALTRLAAGHAARRAVAKLGALIESRYPLREDFRRRLDDIAADR